MSTLQLRTGARVQAEAKINLLLSVRSREPGGYHLLDTLFQRIALADTVTIRLDVRDRSLDSRGFSVGPAESNLGWRAALAFASVARWPDHFAIEIEKRIPVGGGLGGGSADAAAVLRALNALAPRPLGPESLDVIASGLGSDVPYLTSELALALGSGRGERLLALESLPARQVMLLVPPFGVSSAEAFMWYSTTKGRSTRQRQPFLLPLPLSWKTVAGHARNDLEEPVFAHHGELATLRRKLEAAGAPIARMTGSGSTVFGVFESRNAMQAARARIDDGTLGARLIETVTVEHVAPVEFL